jgi:hypothetical protein
LRIDGVTPASINILMIYCKNSFKRASWYNGWRYWFF